MCAERKKIVEMRKERGENTENPQQKTEVAGNESRGRDTSRLDLEKKAPSEVKVCVRHTSHVLRCLCVGHNTA